MRTGTMCGALGIALAMLLPPVELQADQVASFYRGKTLRMLIGYGPGGGYDIYGRLVAEFLPRHIPGNPIFVPQNMPGAGSFLAAKFMAEAAPKDGTVFGSLAQTLALDSLVNANAKIDVTKFSYLGRVVTNIDVGAALTRSGIKSFDDVRQRKYNLGASGGGSTTVLFPSLAECVCRCQVQAGPRLQRHHRHPARHGAGRGRYRRRLWSAGNHGEPPGLAQPG